MGTISSALNVTQEHKRSYQTSTSSINAKSQGKILACMFPQEPNYSQHCNQSGVSLSNDVFKKIF